MANFREEFPDFDDAVSCERLLASGAWEDISWGADQCPTFECDVAIIYVGWIRPSEDEPGPEHRFGVMYEGDDRGSFPTLDLALKALFADPADYPFANLHDEFVAWVRWQKVDPQADAEELLMIGGLTREQIEWLTDFSERWNAADEVKQWGIVPDQKEIN